MDGIWMKLELLKPKRIAAILSLALFLAMSMSFFFHHHSGGEGHNHSTSCIICIAHYATLHKGSTTNFVLCLEMVSQTTSIYIIADILSAPLSSSITRAPPQAA
jgi:hypothetical protein